MVKPSQPWLPKIKPEKIIKLKYPQPSGKLQESPKKFELLHHPFNLKFKGRVRSWIEEEMRVRELILEDFLDKSDGKLVKLYFFPQEKAKKWLNQEEVLRTVHVGGKKKLRERLVEILVKFWEKSRALKGISVL
ncbi:hypothetical protein A2686_01625 [Candidatus Woesebacteria bacterium RIFCSPHIGHO2_01_FULL_38_10]|uniref:Uncharacterized protein n=1 Tax=Candidatus Woesebacteria bacterium RIFCSPLOWO2_01_FULL_39_10b TaxID=1802517 RepID=A0A1F8B6C4_9BACT|nr:MAG: hypothetical protein A2686_01625 [Candidatus Woesebacteria bacterium RIFCSPHIGHO2_01_FULL_38_10]OGM59594.1 MAG: hypothetical protein A2892_04590 [Candidatus Woesebacteria bacterium RIFCSPLOWO2_01_FULL_39_10b]